jgi:hypothetical protein
MSDEKNDLRSILAEATEGMDAPEPTPGVQPSSEIPAKPPEKSSSEPKTAETAPAETRERGPDGKFVPKEAKETPPSTEMPVSEPAKAAEGEEKPAETPTNAAEPPAHWSAADKEIIAKLPAELRGDVVDRWKRMEAGFTPKLQKLAQMEKEFGPAVEIFAPHMDSLRQRGQTPSDVVKIWAQVETGLIGARMAAQSGRSDPQALAATDGGAQIVARIIQAYNIDPGVVASHLQNAMQQQPQGGNGAANGQNGTRYAADPALVQEIQGIKQQLGAWQQQETTQRIGQAQNQIEQFANEKNADGTLKHPFFSDLEDDITQMAAFERSQGKPIDLSALYERAVWATPSTREQLVSQRQAEAKRAAADEARAKAEAARKASSSISGAPTPGSMPQAAPTNRGLRDQIVTALEEQQ